MIFVRVQDGIVQEIIPTEATVPSVAAWYGAEFAAQCVEAPEGVCQGWVYNSEIKTFVNPLVKTVEELRTAALARIDGKCEEAIVSDLTVEGIVYPMTHGTAQDDLARAVARTNAGDTAIPYGPHGQFASLYTPERVQAVDKAFYSRCIVNRTYYGLLQAWIGTESRTAKLTAIDYGCALPSAYTTLLTAQMTAVGIDVSEFISALTAV